MPPNNAAAPRARQKEGKMPNSIFITAIGQVEGKHGAAAAVMDKAKGAGVKAVYFKPIAKGEGGHACAGGDSHALTQAEAFKMLAAGQEGAIMDAVFIKFNELAKGAEMVVIEGLDMVPSGGALAKLDAAIAANLGAPVVLLAGQDVAPAAAALAVKAYRDAFANVVAVAALGAKPDIAGVETWAVAEPKAIAGHLGGDKCVCHAKSAVVTPKSFEFGLIERAKAHKQHIVLPEGNDERILRAADDILAKGFADLTILGDPDAIAKKGKELGLATMLAKAQLINNKTDKILPELTAAFFELRKAKGITMEQAEAQMADRNFFGTMLVKMKKADGMVSGADGTTAATIRPALSIIKTKPGCSIASSVFLMCLADKVWVFGDCAINPNPNPAQLAEIAIISAQTAKAFGVEPKVAMLSYSSGDSGKGPDVDMVKEATALAKASAEKLYPGLAIDGPLQFDAAVDPKTGASKMPGSPVAGQATVMIFPSLSAGNIGYKAVQRSAKAVAIGPVIQGLNAPVNDLSRGTLVADIINTVAITALQAIAG